MFTGIIEGTAPVQSFEVEGSSAKLSVAGPWTAADLEIGESISINGCCLTLTHTTPNDGEGCDLHFDLLGETLRLTSLGGLSEGSTVNLERALRVGDRLGGHFVLGHVDATGTVDKLDPRGADIVLGISYPPEHFGVIPLKGSITIDGISLTISQTESGVFECWITPHTAQVTTINTWKIRDRVNLEFDVLARYLAHLQATGAS